MDFVTAPVSSSTWFQAAMGRFKAVGQAALARVEAAQAAFHFRLQTEQARDVLARKLAEAPARLVERAIVGWLFEPSAGRCEPLYEGTNQFSVTEDGRLERDPDGAVTLLVDEGLLRINNTQCAHTNDLLQSKDRRWVTKLLSPSQAVSIKVFEEAL